MSKFNEKNNIFLSDIWILVTAQISRGFFPEFGTWQRLPGVSLVANHEYFVSFKRK